MTSEENITLVNIGEEPPHIPQKISTFDMKMLGEQ
jgi:hypothetical protein